MDSKGNIDAKLIDYHLPLNFSNGAFIEIGKNPNVEVLDEPFKLNSTTTIPAGTYKYHEYFITGRPDASRKLQPTGRFGVGPFYSGYKHSYTGGLAWRVNHKANTSFNYTHNNISLPGTRLKTNLLSTRFNYSFSTAVFLNALVQYNSDSRQWSSNVRFNIIHRPLSDIFLVYNERRNSLTGDMIDRAIVAKMTYMFSR
jgi:hypothetical protein